MKNNNLSQLDHNQMVQKMFDAQTDSQRVSIVGGDKIELTIDSDKIAGAVKEGLSQINWNKEQKQESVQQLITQIEKNVFIPQLEIKTIEVPVIIKEIEYREIEKPIYIEKIITIEKPIVIKEIEFREIIKQRDFPLFIKLFAGLQAICMLGILLTYLFKK